MESVFCGNCGARLAPLTAAPTPAPTPTVPPIKGLSLPTKPSTPPTPSNQEESSTPDWLQRLRETPPVEEEPTVPPAPVSGDAPDWIKALRSQEPREAEAAATPSAPTPPSAETNEPDWLTRLRAAVPEEPLPTEGEQTESESFETPDVSASEPQTEMPSWVEHLGAEEPTLESEPTQESTAPKEGEAPDWLAEIRAQAPTEQAETPTESADEIPDWLQAATGGELPQVAKVEAPAAAEITQSKEPVEEQPVVPVPEGELPTWLEELHSAAAESGETEEPVPAETLIQSVEEQAGSAEQPLETVAASAEEAINPDDLPGWLRLAMPIAQGEEEQLEPPLDIPAAPVIEPAKPEEVPAWVAALKPAQAMPPSPNQFEAEPAEMAGPLTGLRGVLPLAVAVAEPHLSTKVAPAPETRRDARFFDAILAEPSAESELPTVKKAKRVWTLRPLIYLALALAVFVPFLLPYNLAGSTIKISNTPAAEFYDSIQQLPAGTTVVLAFDYDPSMMGEMDLQANAIVRDLVRRQVKIIALSTLETGPQIAQRILDQAAADSQDYRYGSEYLNLGFLPGHEAGLAQLAANGLPLNSQDFVQKQNLGSYPVTANVRTLRDVALVVELAGSEESLKMWMEQVQSRGDARIVAGVSAGVEPKARAYRNAQQLVAVLSGLVGAAQYEILSNQPGLALTSVNAQSAAQVVLIAIIVLGNIVYWISRARGKAK